MLHASSLHTKCQVQVPTPVQLDIPLFQTPFWPQLPLSSRWGPVIPSIDPFLSSYELYYQHVLIPQLYPITNIELLSRPPPAPTKGLDHVPWVQMHLAYACKPYNCMNLLYVILSLLREQEQGLLLSCRSPHYYCLHEVLELLFS